MSLEAVKRELRRRRRHRSRACGSMRGRVKLGLLRGQAEGGCAAGGASRRDDPGGALLAMAADLEALMDSDADSEGAVGSSAPAREGEPVPGRAGGGKSHESRDSLDQMRKLWRRMRRDLPQIPFMSGNEMRKEELVSSLLGVLGIGWAPLPEWGCPEGVDEFVSRLMRTYVRPLAEMRGCPPSALRLPLSNGSADEELVAGLLCGAWTPTREGAAAPGAVGAL